MRLGIDAREIQNGVYTGIGHPLHHFLKYFAQHASPEDTCVLFSAKPVPLDYGPKVKNVVIPETSTILWDQVRLAKAIHRENIYLFYSPYYKIPLWASCITVSAILDIMYLRFEPYRKQMGFLKELYYKVAGKCYTNKADRIMTCSEFSKKDIMDFYRVPADKIKVIHLSVGDQYRPETDPEKLSQMKARFKLDSRYILYLGNLKPHKNVENIVRAFAAVVQTYPDLKLVLAGPLEYTYNELLALIERLYLKEKVVYTGKITEKDQPHLLYSGAEVFCMPSVYEGFGLPVIEAMACGTPVVTSDRTSLPEIVKEAGLMVNPEDVSGIASAIKRILGDPSLREQLIQKGLANAKNYQETKIAGELYAFFKQLCQTVK